MSVPLTVLQTWSDLGVQEIRGFINLFATEHSLKIDWDSWSHSEAIRTGSVDFTDNIEGNNETLVRVNWSYDPLDDPDNSAPLELPNDHMKHVTGVLTPDQLQAFWDCVDPELMPLTHLDYLLRRLGLTPADHDELDHEVMLKVIAIQWWRSYPTTTAGHKALKEQPNLTSTVLDQINTMAINCYLDAEQYDLHTTFVA
jgi:hypothetical protein